MTRAAPEGGSGDAAAAFNNEVASVRKANWSSS